jgi:hypothetical protein
MQLDNALYAGVHIPHNFGAAVAVALPLAALHFEVTGPTLHRIYWLALFAWLVKTQAASASAFGHQRPLMAHGYRLRIRLSRRLFGVQRTRSIEALVTQVDPLPTFSARPRRVSPGRIRCTVVL